MARSASVTYEAVIYVIGLLVRYVFRMLTIAESGWMWG